MKTFVQAGEVLEVTAPGDVTSGLGVLVGAIFGIAQHAAASGDPVQIQRRGVFTHAKAGSQAWTAGAKLYWDNTNAVFTTTASGNTLVGAAALAAGASDTTGTVLLDGAIR